MTNATLTGHRGATVAVLVVGGGGLATATWVGGDHGLAIGLTAFYAVAAVAAYIWSGRDGDVGAIVSAARNHGDIGGYGVICFVGGVTYALSLLVLKRRS